MKSNNNTELKLKLASEFKELPSFIEKLDFYERHQKELTYQDPQDPLILEFENCDTELEKLKSQEKSSSSKAVHRTNLSEMQPFINRKIEIHESLIERDKAMGICKPEPSNDEEGGQMIEYFVKKYEMKPTFEELKNNFEAGISRKRNKSQSIEKQLEKVNKKFDECSKPISSSLTEPATWLYDVIKPGINYEIDFSDLYKLQKMSDEEKKSLYPLYINYEKLSSAITLYRFKCFLEDCQQSNESKNANQETKGDRSKAWTPDPTDARKILNRFDTYLEHYATNQAGQQNPEKLNEIVKRAIDSIQSDTNIGISEKQLTRYVKSLHNQTAKEYARQFVRQNFKGKIKGIS